MCSHINASLSDAKSCGVPYNMRGFIRHVVSLPRDTTGGYQYTYNTNDNLVMVGDTSTHSFIAAAAKSLEGTPEKTASHTGYVSPMSLRL